MKFYKIYYKGAEFKIEADEIDDHDVKLYGLRLRRNGKTIVFFESVNAWIEIQVPEIKREEDVDKLFSQFTPS